MNERLAGDMFLGSVGLSVEDLVVMVWEKVRRDSLMVLGNGYNSW